MQLSVTTAMTQPSTLSPFKQRQERQPNQPLEASVADSFTPSTAQSRSGANGKINFASFVASSLLLLTACGQQAVKEAAPVVRETLEAKVAPVLENEIKDTAPVVKQKVVNVLEQVRKIKEDTSIEPINVISTANGLADESLNPPIPNVKLGERVIQALECKKTSDGKYTLLFPNVGKPLQKAMTQEGCAEVQLDIGEQIGRTSMAGYGADHILQLNSPKRGGVELQLSYTGNN